MWSCACAAVGVVAEGVHVDATLSVGIVAGDAPCDGGGRGLGVLGEGHGALDVGVTTENCDYSLHQHTVFPLRLLQVIK